MRCAPEIGERVLLVHSERRMVMEAQVLAVLLPGSTASWWATAEPFTLVHLMTCDDPEDRWVARLEALERRLPNTSDPADVEAWLAS